MDHQAQPVDTQQPPALNLLGQLIARLSEYGQNATNNISQGFNNMSPQSWIRVIVIAGGYMLLRPYLMKAVTKGAVEKMERDDKKERGEDGTLPHPELTPNEYRGIKDKLYADDENTGGDGTTSDWGQKARVRQRKMLRELLEEDERRRAALDEDADIQEFLED
ncbi:trafficking PGA2 domain-containing protein [Pochonia chlamydosporia 170]|uniref:Trafficking PGA2 domain-containing protein n=1 Tax=Pochonia chlamydosporia 170 TaxID=1380566 RepID=A0A179FFS4_METCM|nr:trafficking PGA2 domain-containing protein [Pochonia chlamydosporia 170]OAQ64384.1 trafficking PGA2 domain-containing protein [Pochonia chlamydosporia 170]